MLSHIIRKHFYQDLHPEERAVLTSELSERRQKSEFSDPCYEKQELRKVIDCTMNYIDQFY